jgi:hypothetical protein
MSTIQACRQNTNRIVPSVLIKNKMKSSSICASVLLVFFSLISYLGLFSQCYFEPIRGRNAVCFSSYQGVIVPAERTEVRLYDPSFNSPLRLRKKDIILAEKAILNSENVKSEFNSRPCEFSLSQYIRQYCGYIDKKGSRFVLITFWYLTETMRKNLQDSQYLLQFCNNMWGLDDGGCNFFYVIFDIKELEIEKIYINGSA